MQNLENDKVIPASDPESTWTPGQACLAGRQARDDKRVVFLSLSGIGNLIMQLPTIEALKKAHPTWHITIWVAPRGTKEIAEAQNYIDEVIEMPVSPPYQGGAGGGLIRHAKNILILRNNYFDIGIVLSPGQLIKSAAYLKLAGIPLRIGNSYPYKGNPKAGNFLTHAIDEQEHLHDIEQNLRLLDPLGIHPESVPYYSLTIPEKNIEEAKRPLPLIKGELEGVKYVGIHAGCAKGFEFKRWPLERFAEVAKALRDKYPNIQFLIFGGKSEEAQKQELAKMIGVDCTQVVSTSLLTTAAIMQNCKLMISNDSGLMHVAAAVGTPTLGIFGPTDEALTGPRGSKSFIVRAEGTMPVYSTEKIADLGTSPHVSMLAIFSQAIIDKIEELGLL